MLDPRIARGDSDVRPLLDGTVQPEEFPPSPVGRLFFSPVTKARPLQIPRRVASFTAPRPAPNDQVPGGVTNPPALAPPPPPPQASPAVPETVASILFDPHFDQLRADAILNCFAMGRPVFTDIINAVRRGRWPALQRWCLVPSAAAGGAW